MTYWLTENRTSDLRESHAYPSHAVAVPEGSSDYCGHRSGCRRGKILSSSCPKVGWPRPEDTEVAPQVDSGWRRPSEEGLRGVKRNVRRIRISESDGISWTDSLSLLSARTRRPSPSWIVITSSSTTQTTLSSSYPPHSAFRKMTPQGDWGSLSLLAGLLSATTVSCTISATVNYSVTTRSWSPRGPPRVQCKCRRETSWFFEDAGEIDRFTDTLGEGD